MHDRIVYQGITFDDVLLEPGYSELLPHQVDTRAQLTSKIGLNIPILSSPMDTVTEAELAIALAAAPRVLLLDEPAAGLSPEETRRMVALVRALKGDIVEVRAA